MPAVPFPYDEFDLSGIHTYPLASRASKARAEDFAGVYRKGDTVGRWLSTLPRMLARRRLARGRRSHRGRQARRPGNRVGVRRTRAQDRASPVLIDLMRRGYVSALATNGAGIIHDFEIALSGATSEDVDDTLGPGRVRDGRGNRHEAERGDQRRRRDAAWASGKPSAGTCADPSPPRRI